LVFPVKYRRIVKFGKAGPSYEGLVALAEIVNAQLIRRNGMARKTSFAAFVDSAKFTEVPDD